MYRLLEAALNVLSPAQRATRTVRIHVEEQLTRKPIAGASIRVNNGPWKIYNGPEEPVEADLHAGRRVRVEVSKPGWIDPRPHPYVDTPVEEAEIHLGLM